MRRCRRAVLRPGSASKESFRIFLLYSSEAGVVSSASGVTSVVSVLSKEGAASGEAVFSGKADSVGEADSVGRADSSGPYVGVGVGEAGGFCVAVPGCGASKSNSS